MHVKGGPGSRSVISRLILLINGLYGIQEMHGCCLNYLLFNAQGAATMPNNGIKVMLLISFLMREAMAINDLRIVLVLDASSGCSVQP